MMKGPLKIGLRNLIVEPQKVNLRQSSMGILRPRRGHNLHQSETFLPVGIHPAPLEIKPRQIYLGCLRTQIGPFLKKLESLGVIFFNAASPVCVKKT